MRDVEGKELQVRFTLKAMGKRLASIWCIGFVVMNIDFAWRFRYETLAGALGIVFGLRGFACLILRKMRRFGVGF